MIPSRRRTGGRLASVRRLRIVATTALLLASLATPGSARAPDAVAYRWTNVTVGAGGYAPNIVFSAVERGLAYLRTDMGGAYRWDEKSARWMPLQDGNAVPSYMGIESIAPDPRDPDVVYMAAGVGASQPAAILRSADRGRSWRITPVPFAMGGNEDGRGLGERLAIDPNSTQRLFFGSRHDGLWRSDDAGATWAKVARFPVAGLARPGFRRTHGGIAFVAIDPTSGGGGRPSGRVWAGVADPGATHLYRSDDAGETWVAVTGPALLAAHGPEAGLAKWLHRYTEFLATKRGLAAALHSGDPAFGALPAYFRARFEPALASLLAAAAATGAFRADIAAYEADRPSWKPATL